MHMCVIILLTTKCVCTRIIKNIFNKNERCRDVKTQKVCEQGQEANVGPKIKPLSYISTALCILLYTNVGTYVELYGSCLFNFGSQVNFLTLYTYTFWVLTSRHGRKMAAHTFNCKGKAEISGNIYR